MRAANSFTPIDGFSASTGPGSDNIDDAGQILGQYNILSNGLVGASPLGNISLTWASGFAAAPLTGNMGSLGVALLGRHRSWCRRWLPLITIVAQPWSLRIAGSQAPATCYRRHPTQRFSAPSCRRLGEREDLRSTCWHRSAPI